jgi:hypothetical protein
MKRALSGLLIFVGLAGCDTGVEMDNIPPADLLSVSGVVSPQDSSLKVYIYRSFGLFETVQSTSFPEPDAKVLISDGTKEVVLQYYPEQGRYECLNPFAAAEGGTVFTLTVLMSDKVVATAETVLPPKPKLTSFKKTERDGIVDFDIAWDNSGAHEHRYFQAWGTREGQFMYFVGHIKETSLLQLEPEVVFWDNQPVGVNTLKETATLSSIKGTAKFSFILANVEEGWWKYHVTIGDYQNWLANAEEPTIIPTFREPGEVYNNIKGGFGLFTCYNPSDSLIWYLEGVEEK